MILDVFCRADVSETSPRYSHDQARRFHVTTGRGGGTETPKSEKIIHSKFAYFAHYAETNENDCEREARAGNFAL